MIDASTIEIQKDRFNKVQVQVVGDSYMYGSNYIYEPVYVSVPVIYNCFWTPRYNPYYSVYYWDYYPSYYYAWNPYPLFRYRHNVGLCINFNYQYNYVNYRRCQVAYNDYYGRRGNYYESQYPNRSFRDRNTGYSNRRELEQTRTRHDVAYDDSPRSASSSPRNFDNPRSNSVSPRGNATDSPRNNSINSPRTNASESPRVNASESPRSFDSPRQNESPRNWS